MTDRPPTTDHRPTITERWKITAPTAPITNHRKFALHTSSSNHSNHPIPVFQQAASIGHSHSQSFAKTERLVDETGNGVS
jgi:hypothetical protein